jgi:hypothetical protein
MLVNQNKVQFNLIVSHNLKRNHMMKKLLGGTVLCLAMAASVAMSQGKFSGYMFGDYYYNVGRDAGVSGLSNVASPAGGQNYSAFQLRRAYFTYDNDISEQFTTRFRLEADQGANAGTTTTGDALASGKVGVFVKDAYLTWKNVFAGSNLIFGVQPTPAYEVSEAAWGYRSLEKTIMDLRSVVDSRDLGLSLKGKILDDGTLNYWVMFGNGAGTAKYETDMYKRYYAHIQYKPITNLQATAYVDYKDAAGNATGSTGTWTEAFFVGYNEPFAYNIGAEVYMSSPSNSYTPPGGSLGSKKAAGYSIFGSYNIIPELAAVLRYDNYDPNTDGASTYDARNYVIAGLSWKVDKNVSIQPNVLYETYDAPAAGKGTPDPSVTARVTMYYVFL